ncbi:Ent-kaurene oxidase-like protein [Hapsidospora chrysogenum ATCC 11550]|uniref:Ent-kaurene oxidase-like protein n=1 Tax=Hapsidospora chrysogenum (strain ATCC 11550 / CBS 779.69 / DSM 880 / IAM 14645 / JCM 23072 / IMI 49137) TaxID=857340 RepID=A0A086SW54_HAPC1|nr:Ent-kaurene oxidase-like protein [Hapsidospora chrysogenum ATCC 11550]
MDTLLKPTVFAPAFIFLAVILRELIRPKLPYEVNPRYPKLPVVGARPGEWFPELRAKWRNTLDIRKSTEEAYRYKDQACLFPIVDLGSCVILPPCEVSWFHSQPEEILSAHIHQLNAFQLNYTVTDPRLVAETNPIHQVLINTKLTRETNSLLPALADEIAAPVDELWGLDDANYKQLCLMDEMPDVIGRVVNRVFVGARCCKNKTLVNSAVTFSRGLGFTSVLLRCTAVVLRPLLGAFLTLPQKIATWRFFRELRPEVHRRLSAVKEGPEAQKELSRKHKDFLQWTIDAALDDGDPYMLKPDTIMGRVLLLNFVAIHTTSFAIAHVLMDLAANAVENIDELREEIVAGLRAQPDEEWSKQALLAMPKLDSVFRESQRMNSIVTVASPKPVCSKDGVTTPSGVHLEYGSYVAILSYPILNDPAIYPDPDKFQPFRFANARAEAGKQGLLMEKARQGWTSVTRTYTAFGTGMHACPGRFFAANLLKVMLAYLLLHYDLEKLPIRPRNSTFSVSIFPPLRATVKFRRRKHPVGGIVWKRTVCTE